MSKHSRKTNEAIESAAVIINRAQIALNDFSPSTLNTIVGLVVNGKTVAQIVEILKKV